MELTNDFRVALPVEQAWVVLTDLERIAPCMPGAQLQEVEGDDYRGVVKVKVGPITAQYKGQATFLSRDEGHHVAVLRAEGRETRGQGNAHAIITASLTPDGSGTAVSVVTDLTVTGRVAQFGRGVLADVSAKLLGQFVDCLEQSVLAGETPPPVSEAAGAPTAPAEVAGSAPESAKPTASAEDAGSAPESTEPAASAEDAGSAEPAPERATAGAPEHAGSAPVDAAPSGAAAATSVAPESATAPTPAPSAPAAPAGPRKIDHPEAEPVDLIGAAGSPVAKRVGPVLAVIAIVWLLKKLFGRRRT
jgi:hypothetical protein